MPRRGRYSRPPDHVVRMALYYAIQDRESFLASHYSDDLLCRARAAGHTPDEEMGTEDRATVVDTRRQIEDFRRMLRLRYKEGPDGSRAGP